MDGILTKQIALHTDSIETTAIAKSFRKELLKRNLYTEDIENADIVFNLDSIHKTGIKKGKKLTFYYEIDDFMHRGKNVHWYFNSSLVYIVHPYNLGNYPPNTRVMPPAVDPEVHKPLGIERPYDYVFVGNIEPLSVYEDRILTLGRLGLNPFSMAIFCGKGNDYVRDSNLGKIILNILPREGEAHCINARNYEAMAMGCLMVNEAPGLEVIGEKNKHYLTLDKYGKVTDEEIATISKASREHVLANHTWSHRVDQLLADIKERL